ncbi:serine/threonine-protein kinase [Myxococcus landrumensis]|uniref:non-specific serine/threonine protein kinase n=1 Tax=Myxococcus landrumensis TaxID=2813577 RepID=A0ABX7MX84_9BACT|nr:serine/threonine-protein kinase [Myxococcus landrumus]QSQ11057.1 serine/threonine protein kinase [Myxococcus landrumus]
MNGLLVLDAPEGTDIAGYTVEGLLGAGGCGVVYRASRDGQSVALKLQSLEHLGDRAVREVDTLTRLTHHNVVGFRGGGLFPPEAPEWLYLAMEYVRGRPLAQWVEEENPGARRVAELALGMARGLEAAHASDVLHRDIKEANVLVREEDGTPVLMDFGVGESAQAPRPPRGVLPPGTPRYRSPEALMFRREGREGVYPPTAADDLYALGVVLYWMLTARHPFENVETPEGELAVIHHPPVTPGALNRRVPWVLSELCLRLLSKEPWRRGTASTCRMALEVALDSAEAAWDVPLFPDASELPADLQGQGTASRGRRTTQTGGLPAYPGSVEPAETPRLVVHARPVSRRGHRRELPLTLLALGVGACLMGGAWWARRWHPAVLATALSSRMRVSEPGTRSGTGPTGRRTPESLPSRRPGAPVPAP